MADAANIQIKIDTSEAEKAERVLAALEGRSDKLHQALQSLDKGTTFDKLRVAATGVNTSFDKLNAANDSVIGSLAGVDRQATAAGGALVAMGSSRAAIALNDTSASALKASTNLALVDKSNTDIALNDIANSAGKADAAFRKIGVDAVADEFDDMATSAKKADTALDNTSKRGLNVRDSFNAIKIAVAAVTAAVGATVGVFVNLSDRYQSMNAGLRIVTDGTVEFQTAQSALIQSAKDTRTPLEDINRLYAGMAPSLDEMGRAQSEVLRVTELVSKALKVGGGAASEHTAALQQFTQAMGSGVLRGDEFNSIMENGRGLAIQLAEGLDVPVGALRAMAEAGDLTADKVVDALLRQGAAIDGLFDSLPVTSGQAWTLVKNQALLAIGEIDESLGIANAWSGLLVSLASSMEGLFDGLNETILDVKAEWISFQLNLQTSDDTAYRAMRAIGEAIDDIGSAIAPAMPYITQFAGAMATISAGYGGYLLVAAAITGIGTAFTFMGKAVLANPIIAAVTAIGAAAYVIYDNWDGIVEWWEGVMTSMEAAVDDFAGAGSWDALTDAASAVWDGILKAFEIGLGMLGGIVQSGLQILRGDFVAGWDTLVETANDFGDALLGVIFELLDVMKQSGTDLIVWMGQGISDGITFAVEAAKGVGTGIVDSFVDAGKGMFDAGADVAQGFIDGLIARVPGLESTLRFMGILPEEVLRDETETQSPSRVTFRVGTDVAQGLADGLSAGMDAVGYAARQLADHTKGFFTDLYDATVRSIADADSIKDAFGGIGDFMQDWLKKWAAHFLANKLMVSLGLDGSGLESGLGGIVSTIGKSLGLLGSSAATHAAGVSSLAGNIDILGAGASGASGAVNILGSSTAGASGSFGVLAADVNGAGAAAGSASGGFSSFAASAGGAALLAGGLGYAVGELGGAANSAAVGVLSAVGSLVGGPLGAGLGAALGSAFGGSWRHIEQGLELAFKDGDLTGRSYEYFEKERSGWRGTATRIIYEELDGEIAEGLSNFMQGLGNTITTLAEGLGIEGADKIMSSFEIASAKLNGGDMEAQLDAYFNRVSLGAYRAIYDNMGPQMQAAIDGMIITTLGSTEQVIAEGGGLIQGALNKMNADMANAINDEEVAAAVEQWEAALAEVSIVIYDLVPLMDGLGIQMGESTDEIQANTLAMSESFGGAANAFAMISDFANKFAPEGELAAIRLEQATTALNDWNISIGRGPIALGENVSALDTWRSSLDLSTESGFNMSRILDSFVTGVDASTGALQVNTVGLESYRASLDTTTEYGATAAANIDVLNAAVLAGGDGAITTSQQMYDYAMSLDWSTEAGLAAAQSAMAVGDALLIVEAENTRLAENLETVNGVYERLNLTVGATSPLTVEAADALVELAGGMDEFARKTNFLYENFYSEQERATLELQQSTAAVTAWHDTLSPLTLQLAGVSDGTVDTAEEFRLLSDYLLSTGQAGTEAWVALLDVGESFLHVVTTGEEASAAIDTLSTDLTSTFEQMRIDAGESTTGLTVAVADSLQSIVLDAQTSGAEMHAALADSFGQVLLDAGVTAEQLPQPLQDAYTAMIDSGNLAGAAITELAATTDTGIAGMADTWRTGLESVVADAGLQGTEMEQALLASFTRMVTDATFTGSEMDRNLALSFQNMLNNAGIAASDLPPALQVGLDAMINASAEAASDMATTADQAAIDSAAMTAAWDANFATMIINSDASGGEMSRILDGTFTEMVTNAGEAGSELNIRMVTAFNELLAQAGITAADLPPALQAGLDAMVGNAGTAATNIEASANATGTSLDGLSGSADDLGGAAVGAAGDTARSAIEVAREMGDISDYMINAAAAAANATWDASLKTISNMYSINANIRLNIGDAVPRFATLGSAIRSAGNAASSAANAFANSRASYDGSHANGLDYVPFDGYVAELHRGEAVLTAAEATQYREAVNEPSFVAPITNISNTQNNAALLAEMQAMRREIEQLRSESGAALGSIASSGQQQVATLKSVEKSNDRTSRKITAAIS